ncbi:MAG: hypothetical protein JJU11_01185 [Candidatus Sumerlaeia bacterium]|nr:hypothetical protein [Candidatus Sumerlaeia bacterium]
MNIFPDGLIQTIHCLFASGPEIREEMTMGDEYSHAEVGELLVLPDGGSAFVGTESLGESNVGIVRLIAPDDLLAHLGEVASLLGDDSGSLENALFRQCVSLSIRLQQVAAEGGVVRIEDDGKRYLSTPTGERLALSSA